MAYIGKQPARIAFDGTLIADDSIESADIKEGTIVDSDINAAAGIATTKVTGAVTSITSHGLATSATTDTTNADNIGSGTLPDARFPATLPAKSGVNLTALNATNLGSGTVPTVRLGTGTADATTFLRGDGSWQVVAVPSLDSPVITGALTLLPSAAVTHTIANWSDDVSYTITPTNCTAGAVNGSGEFVITHTSGVPSYTILATTASLGLDDSALVTKNMTVTLTAPTLSSPADVGTAVDVIYTITSTDSNDDKLILDPGTANFTYQSESGPGTASKVGNTVECVGFGTGNPVVTIRFTAEATYSVTAKAVKIDGSYGTSANSSADSIVILNPTLSAPSISSPADVGTLTNAAYTITSNDSNDDKLILNIGSSNFNFGSVSVGSASKVGNTVECTGFTTNNPVVTIQFTAEATYSVTATAEDTTGYYHDSVASSADSITIQNYVYGGESYGYTHCGAPYTYYNTIDRYSFASCSADAVDQGDGTDPRAYLAGNKSATHGYTSGGETIGYTNIVDKFNYSGTFSCSDVGDLPSTDRWNSGVNDTENAIAYVVAGDVDYDRITKITTSSDSIAQSSANLYAGSRQCAGCGSETHGYTMGGGPAPADSITKFTYASESTGTDVADLISRYGQGATSGQSSTDYAYTAGAESGGKKDVIQKHSFSGGGNSTDVGDILAPRGWQASQSSTDYGYVSGGDYPTAINVIERYPFSSDTNSSDVGNLSLARYGPCGSEV